MFRKIFISGLFAIASVCLFGCHAPIQAIDSDSPKQPPEVLSFIDIARFDNEMQRSMSSALPNVTITFYESISPNSTPERLQKWLNAVDKKGGRIVIDPPPGDLTPRDPFFLIGLLGSLWDVIKVGTAVSETQMFESVRGRDALISLERRKNGEVVISKITFTRKAL